jgi:hypothetical protein
LKRTSKVLFLFGVGALCSTLNLNAQPINKVWDVLCDNVGAVMTYSLAADSSNVYLADYLINDMMVKVYNKETGALL